VTARLPDGVYTWLYFRPPSSAASFATSARYSQSTFDRSFFTNSPQSNAELNYCPIVAMEQIMTPDFVDGILITLLPSMLMVAWLAWRAPAIDSDF
jgi:hypothetical protein